MASPKSDSSKVSAKQPGLGKDSAEQPEPPKYLPLPELNNASAKIGGSWIVDAFREILSQDPDSGEALISFHER